MDDDERSKAWKEADAIWWNAVRALKPGLTQEEQDAFAAMDWEVRTSLASNPTISLETFLRLEEDDELHEALIHNPALPAEILERWAFGHEFDPTTHPNATDIVRAFAETEDDRDASHDNTTYDILNDWVNGSSRFMERSLWRKHKDHAPTYFENEAEAQRIRDEFLLELWALSLPFTPTHALERITEKFLPRLLKRASPVTNVSTAPQVAVAIEKSSDAGILLHLMALVATHQNASPTLLKELADTGYLRIGLRVARNANASLPTLKRLMRVNDKGLAIAVASHPAKKVQKLVTDLSMRETEVQAALARNTHLAAWQLDEMVNTDSVLVLASLAANASYKPSDPDRLSGHEAPYVRRSAATNPNFDVATLQRLGSDPDASVRQALATNAAAPVASLVKLHATDVATHAHLAVNPATPHQILASLSHDTRYHHALARNPHLPVDIQRLLATSGLANVTRSLARNPGTAPDVLHELASNLDERTQWLVSIHDFAEPMTLERLRNQDRHWRARFAARRRLEDAAGDMDIYAPTNRPKKKPRLSDIPF